MKPDTKRENEAIAHMRKNEDGSWAEPQGLNAHLAGSAELAEEFARVFGSDSWARACGLAHDTGKSPEAWQRYLKTKSGYDEDAHLETKVGKMDWQTREHMANPRPPQNIPSLQFQVVISAYKAC